MAEPLSVLRERFAQPDAAEILARQYRALLEQYGQVEPETSYSDLGIPIGARAPERDPREGLPLWARQADAYPQSFEPNVGMWPTPKAAKEGPVLDLGPPLIGDGGEFSPGSPAVNRAADVASNVANEF